MRLDELEFARAMMPLVYLLVPASSMYAAELSDARLAYAMEIILVTPVDDLFDVGGSREEMENLVTLIEKYQNSPQIIPALDVPFPALPFLIFTNLW